MKTFKQMIAEVAQPKSKDELNFKDKHEIEMMDHPESEEHQHTSDKPKAKRLADYKKGEDMTVYEAKHDDEDEVDENAFVAKAAAAKKAGKEKFKLGDKEFPVTIKKDTADKITEETDVKWLVTWRKEQSPGKYMDASAFFETEREARMYKGKLKYMRSVLKNSPAMKKIKQTEADKRALAKESVELEEAKTDIYHKHMLKALGKTRLPKNHSFTSAIATNGDFVVKDGGSRIVGRIPKGEHDLKESTDLNENFKTGSLTLRDGSKVVVNKKDADLLNQMFKDLNAQNKREMMKVAMTDKAGFEEIRGFAREAL